MAFSINRPKEEARLYFDGGNVAIYYIGTVKDMQSGMPVCIGSDKKAKESSRCFEGAVDEVGYYLYLASPNLSVISRYPIHDTWILRSRHNCAVTTIELSPGQKLTVSSLWLHYLPAWNRDVRAKGATAEKLIAGEGETRHAKI